MCARVREEGEYVFMSEGGRDVTILEYSICNSLENVVAAWLLSEEIPGC